MNPKFTGAIETSNTDQPSRRDRDPQKQEDYLNADNQILKLKEENYNLRSSLKDLQIKMNIIAKSRDQEVQEIQGKLDRAFGEMNSLKAYAEDCENKNTYLQKKLDLFEGTLKGQIKNHSQSKDDLLEEIEQIEDPFALVIINKLLFNSGIWTNEPTDRRYTKSSFKSAPENEMVKRSEQTKLQNRLNHLQHDFKDLSVEVSTLKTQNQFLLKQLEFAEKQLVSKGVKSSFGKSDLGNKFNTELQICSMFGIQDESRMIDSLLKIQRAYQYVPVMQETLEQIFSIVTDNHFMPVNCNSTTQLVEVLENWVDNLKDYQNLVTQLFDILNVQEENLKNRTHLITSIKELAMSSTRRDHFLSSMPKADKENVQFETNEILDEFKKLKKMNNTTEFFCEEAKNKLKLPPSYSSEALYTKILRVLENPELLKDLNKTETSFAT